jgi:hypothetical protein
MSPATALRTALQNGDLRIALNYALHEVGIERRYAHLIPDGNITGRGLLMDRAPVDTEWSNNPLGREEYLSSLPIPDDLFAVAPEFPWDSELGLALRDQHLRKAMELAAFTLLFHRFNQAVIHAWNITPSQDDSPVEGTPSDTYLEGVQAYVRTRLGDDAPLDTSWLEYRFD